MLNVNDYPYIFHEIKNMISIIGSSLQLVEKQHSEVQEFAYWKETMSDVERLRQMVQDVSCNSSPTQLQMDYVNLPQFLFALKSAAEALFPEHAQIRLTVDPTIPDGYFDSLRIHQALLNLIKNASEAAGEQAKLSICAYYCGNNLVFEISDNGSGIPAETADRLFVPFYTTKENGSGLGLSIVKGIVDAHKGSISVVSAPGWNTTFVIELPCAAKQTGKSDPVCEVS
jgi:nitrogen-specific signal transduction histidine kinase